MQKEEILTYAEEHGNEAAIKKFKINDSTLYRWKRILKKKAAAKKRATARQTRKSYRASETAKFAASAVIDLQVENDALRAEIKHLKERESKLSKALVDSLLAQQG